MPRLYYSVYADMNFDPPTVPSGCRFAVAETVFFRTVQPGEVTTARMPNAGVQPPADITHTTQV